MAAARSIYSKTGLFCSKSRVGVVQDVLKVRPTPADIDRLPVLIGACLTNQQPVFGSSRSMATETSFTNVKVIPAEPPAPVPFAIRKRSTLHHALHIHAAH